MARIVLVLTVVASTLSACGASDSGDRPGRTEVVASFYPLAWAAERVGGDAVRVRNMTPTGAEPHDTELTARDVERIRSADVVFYLGGDFQPAVENAVAGAEGTAVDLLDDPVGDDPHIWLDPLRFERLAARIEDALGGSADAAPLTKELRSLDAEFESGLADCRRRELVTAHDAFGYLARRYRLKQVPITGISPEAEPTPRQLERAIARVKSTNATTVFFETLVSPRLAETVARETGARTAVLDPVEGLTEEQLHDGENYLTVMRENLTAIRKALECR